MTQQRAADPLLQADRAIIEARGLVKTYRLGGSVVRALDGVNLTVERGELMAVMGRSGSGKTTLLNVLGGLDRPDAGQVVIDGVDIARLNGRRLPQLRRQKVGFVFQEFNLIPTLTALENVELPLRYARVARGERRRRALEALALVGMADRARHRPSQLSGGEQQRVALARALVNRPAIVLADEPTGELDTYTAAQVMELVQRLNREAGQTFIIVTHDPAIAQRCRRVVRMEDGRIVSDERREER
ncbi:MAG: ABC transporter ATP-binding protein [Dehalococcoidia bacterium]|jgi:putative ABC transport system ATP-binding protein|nr:ABC transporter ATP-binding protein [Dehalococcoidia bacterium]MDW8009504.1 ABC transporter ATP-binding protein [Chloroflexota bacterium]